MPGVWKKFLRGLALLAQLPRVLNARGALVLVGVTLFALATTAMAQYIEPVDAPVVDGYRPPEHYGGPGNRGWEYSTPLGTPVRAAANGVVRFAGPIGSSLYVSIVHPDGLRTTYSRVASISVRRGDTLTVGSVVATSLSTFHFGVVARGDYLDPALLFDHHGFAGPRPEDEIAAGGRNAAAVLVPRRGRFESAMVLGVGVSGRYQ